MQNDLISIITVNYGNSAKIKKLWKSLKQNLSIKFEFIVVDNASPHNDAQNFDFLEKDSASHLVKLSENIGFGGGNWEGSRFATGNILAIINPDIEIQTNCFEKLLSVLNNPQNNAGIVVPQLENPDGTLQENCRKFPSLSELFLRRTFKTENPLKKESLQKESEFFPTQWAQGSFLVMKKEFFINTLKGFDPRFFLFLEDTDLCRRTWENDKRVLCVKSARAFHGTTRLSGGTFFQVLRKKTFWIHVVSTFKYFMKYLGHKKPKIK
ncbi:glycosyltransferase [Candidatus Gracilibacteria bacterium]|nr:glycosyltransferase [Candidatus Gracilibacteria bacterium]